MQRLLGTMITLLRGFTGRKISSEPITLLSIFILWLFFSACNKDEPTPTRGPDIYVAGSEGYNAKYWKNGIGVELTKLTDGYAEASAIVVSGGDVYVAGSIIAQGITTAVYWKNGTLETLSNGTMDAYTSSIAVSGSDVYVVGAELDLLDIPLIAKYWNNGTDVVLTDGSSWANATSITVSGEDVYVAGTEYNGTVSVAKYWKNGVPVTLGDGKTYSQAYSIAVSGGDVYVAGAENGSATYWKNGNAVVLANDGYAISIAISGDDVYVAGGISMETHSVATYWKNGSMVHLSRDADNAYASSIAVLGNDVFVAGKLNKARAPFLKHEYPFAVYWKNGIAVPVTDGNEDVEVHSMFIVR